MFRQKELAAVLLFRRTVLFSAHSSQRHAGTRVAQAPLNLHGIRNNFHGTQSSKKLDGSSHQSKSSISFVGFCAASTASGLGISLAVCERETETPQGESVTNWSGTHTVSARVIHRPETLEDLERIVAEAQETGQKIRPLGSGISPNGIGLCEKGMVNLALMDEVLNVDKGTGRVTVQAGARVEQVVEALRPHGLTLQNYASVREQQIGGFIQVGAHGTGASIPPVDEQVVALKLVTPAKGTIDLSPHRDPGLFYMARCGLGSLGVVAEATLQAVPSYLLLEESFVTDVGTIRKHHREWLSQYKHMRYMWIPYTSAIVVVRSNPLGPPSKALGPIRSSPSEKRAGEGHVAKGGPGKREPEKERTDAPKSSLVALHAVLCNVTPKCQARIRHASEAAAIAPARQLYYTASTELSTKTGAPQNSEEDKNTAGARAEGSADAIAGVWSSDGSAIAPKAVLTEPQLQALSFTELRDELLALDPLNADHVSRVNRAEADYWRGVQGFRVGWSDQILGFDCGGQQWVSEVCFPATWSNPSTATREFLESAAVDTAGSSTDSAYCRVPELDHITTDSPLTTQGTQEPFTRTTTAAVQPQKVAAANTEAPDIDYVESVMRLIERDGIPAPAPIEQRWTCASRSPMSPASLPTQKNKDYQKETFSWVGIIMYLPSSDPAQRNAITQRFMGYKLATARLLWDQYSAHEHWAKIEIPEDHRDFLWLRERLQKRYSVKDFTSCRECLDPKKILSNDLVDALISE